MDQHLEEDTIFTLLTMPRQTLIPTQSLDGPVAHQLVTVLEPPLPCRVWQLVTTSNLRKCKSSKLPEGIKDFGVLALQTLHNKN